MLLISVSNLSKSNLKCIACIFIVLEEVYNVIT